jgi:hypothetical protein
MKKLNVTPRLEFTPRIQLQQIIDRMEQVGQENQDG